MKTQEGKTPTIADAVNDATDRQILEAYKDYTQALDHMGFAVDRHRAAKHALDTARTFLAAATQTVRKAAGCTDASVLYLMPDGKYLYLDHTTDSVSVLDHAVQIRTDRHPGADAPGQEGSPGPGNPHGDGSDIGAEDRRTPR